MLNENITQGSDTAVIVAFTNGYKMNLKNILVAKENSYAIVFGLENGRTVAINKNNIAYIMTEGKQK